MTMSATGAFRTSRVVRPESVMRSKPDVRRGRITSVERSVSYDFRGGQEMAIIQIMCLRTVLAEIVSRLLNSI